MTPALYSSASSPASHLFTNRLCDPVIYLVSALLMILFALIMLLPENSDMPSLKARLVTRSWSAEAIVPHCSFITTLWNAKKLSQSPIPSPKSLKTTLSDAAHMTSSMAEHGGL